jgi:hypothetical protein
MRLMTWRALSIGPYCARRLRLAGCDHDRATQPPENSNCHVTQRFEFPVDSPGPL